MLYLRLNNKTQTPKNIAFKTHNYNKLNWTIIDIKLSHVWCGQPYITDSKYILDRKNSMSQWQIIICHVYVIHLHIGIDTGKIENFF